jgi:hypothetical protein
VEKKAEPEKGEAAKAEAAKAEEQADQAAPKQEPAGAGTFEALLRRSELVRNLASMLRPFVETCSQEKRYFRRLFCQALTERLKAQHQTRDYHYVAEPSEAGPLVVNYIQTPEPRVEIAVRGCLTCQEPMLEREGGDVTKGRFFVFKTPTEIKVRRGKAVYDLGDINVARYEHKLFQPKLIDPEDELERKQKLWTKKKFESDVLPFIRLDAIYRPVAGATWVGRGRLKYGVLTFELKGHRVYNRCTGEIYGATPPAAKLPPDKKDVTCPQNRPKDPSLTAKLPGTLPQAVVKKLMDEMELDLKVCYEQFGKGGEIPTDLVVAPNGRIKSVKVVGPLENTPTSQCVERLLSHIRFPRFSGRDAKLQWPFVLK